MGGGGRGKTLYTLNSRKHTGRSPKMTGKQLDRLGNMLLKGAEHYGYEIDLWTIERAVFLRLALEEMYGVINSVQIKNNRSVTRDGD